MRFELSNNKSHQMTQIPAENLITIIQTIQQQQIMPNLSPCLALHIVLHVKSGGEGGLNHY